MSTTFQPKPVNGLDMAFGPQNVYDLFPPGDRRTSTPSRDAQKLVSDWFFCGLEKLDVEPREGIDADAAKRHIAAILHSFQPKHEEKKWACATLFDLWFKSFTWKSR